MSDFLIGLVVVGVSLLSYYFAVRIVYFRENTGEKKQKQKP